MANLSLYAIVERRGCKKKTKRIFDFFSVISNFISPNEHHKKQLYFHECS